MTRVQIFISLFAGLFLSACSQPQKAPHAALASPVETPPAAAAAASSAPPVDGATIAQKGSPSGVAACMSCHGAKGEGNAASAFPKIAGEPQEYLRKQLEDYATGIRDNPVMSPIAKTMTAVERDQVSIYYAQMERPSQKALPKISKTTLQLGERLARVGDGKLQLQACNNCHGPDGAGEAPLIPSLAGQHAKYIEAQLMAWKQGQRKSSPQQMVQIVERLDEKSIKALAAYFEQVRLQ